MNILNITRYTHAQKARLTYEHTVISFSISGLVRHSLLTLPIVAKAPFLYILPAGMEVEFEYNHKRENWSIVLDIPAITAGRGPSSIIYKRQPQEIELPSALQIIPEHVSGWEGEFIRMRDAFQAGTPADLLRCETGIYNILRYFLDRRPDMYHATAAAHLRWLIDNDLQAETTLEELSLRCGYSPDHLRIMFEKQYNLSPLEYRNRKRMVTALDLLGNSDLRVKEIATRLGFRHVSHFSNMFKTHFGFTPSQALKRFRQF